MKHFILKFFFTSVFLLIGFCQIKAQSGLCQSTTPYFNVNLVGDPSGTWASTPIVRNGLCCGQIGVQCIEFIVLLDTQAVGLQFSISNPINGSPTYQVNCGPQIVVWDNVCLTGQGPHVVTFCKSGNDIPVYSIKSLTTPSLSYSSTNFCIGAGTASPVITSGYSNSFWEANNNTGLTLNSTTGVIDLQTSSPGVYNIVGDLTPAAPCLSNSLDTFQLTISAGTASTISAVACDTYTVNSQTYTATGTYTQILTNAAGCDSTLTVNLTIDNSTFSTINSVACNSYTENSQTYTSSGNYTQVISNSVGCDSTITINLTINTVDAGITEINNVLSANLAGATYQWIDCNNGNQAIANETFQTFAPTINGSYAVIVTENGCSETSTCMLITTIGIEKNNLKNFLSIYPNPDSGNFMIETSTNNTIEVFNSLGQMILKKNLIPGITPIVLANKSSGVYFISATDEGGYRTTQPVAVVK